MASIPTFLLRSLGRGLTDEEVHERHVKQMMESNAENPVDAQNQRAPVAVGKDAKESSNRERR